MMDIKINMDIKAALRSLDLDQKNVRFGAAVALTKTAQHIKAAEVKEMRDVFSNPNPYTMNSLYVKSATRSDLTARVWLKDDTSKGTPASKYLLPSIEGKARNLKRFEKALISVGAMPAGYRAVPGEAAKLDSYGNMLRGQIVQILAYFRAFPEMGFKSNMTDKSRAAFERRLGRANAASSAAMFVGRPGGGKLPLGIWQRTSFSAGSAIKPVMLFVRHAVYQQIFDFQYVANKTIERHFNPELTSALAMARLTSR